MRHFENLRIGWIIEMVEIYGFINRDHVVRKFAISPQIVSSDFAKKVQKLHPHLMRYDSNAKCYLLKEIDHEDALPMVPARTNPRRRPERPARS